MQKQSLRGGLPEEGVLRVCCEFAGAYLCVGVILIKLQSDFIEIVLLFCYSLGNLLHVWGAYSFKNTPGGLLLNRDNFIYNF